MSDIANELRERSLRAEQEGEPLALLDDAADEIERLRSSHATAVQRLAYEIGRLRLTDEEREAIEVCAMHWQTAPASAVLRRLLERTRDGSLGDSETRQ
jgi:hypothetical protein